MSARICSGLKQNLFVNIRKRKQDMWYDNSIRYAKTHHFFQKKK